MIASDKPPMTEQQATILALQSKIAALGLSARFVAPVSVGPIVSVYKFLPLGSTRVSNIEALSQDFAVTLSVEDVFVKRMPGEAAVGIFVPNQVRSYVQWRDICIVKQQSIPLPLTLGIDINGKPVVEDLSLLPHLLIAGSTGSGKSTLLGSLIASLMVNRPRVQFVMSDTKGVEFNHFDKAKQLLTRTATSVETTVERFDWLIDEMERRLKRYGNLGHRNIIEYNNTRPTAQTQDPYICLVIDELADILGDRTKLEDDSDSHLGKAAERKLGQIAQKARATGIHIIASTQRPSVKLIEGNVKANFPARLTFRLPSEADSRTVLGVGGAEHLISRGDMLFVSPIRPGIQRIHAPIASLEDIQAAVEFSMRTFSMRNF
jgi:DNA segregation ATPase FtsK/SpoIIIE, S-DNA-T family